MKRVVDEGPAAGAPQTFATNRLVIIAPEGTGLSGPGDLTRRGLRLVLATPEVPVGAAIVYATDAIGTDGVEVLEIPAPHNVVATYPIVVLMGGDHPELARTFVDFVSSADGACSLWFARSLGNARRRSSVDGEGGSLVQREQVARANC